MNGAIIGFGFIAEAHLSAYQMLDSFNIIAVVDINKKRLDRARKLIPNVRCCDKFEDLLEIQDLAFIDVCTPPYCRFDYMKKGLENGLHVIGEKPFVLSKEQYEPLCHLAIEQNVILYPSQNYLFAPILLQARNIVQGDSFGSIQSVHFRTLRAGHAKGCDEWNEDWRRVFNFSGGGIIQDHGPHSIYTLCSIINQMPETVSCISGKISNGQHFDGEDTALISLRFDNNIVARIDLSWASSYRDTLYSFYGSNESVIIENNCLIHSQGFKTQRDEIVSDFDDPTHKKWFVSVFKDFETSVTNKRFRWDLIKSSYLTVAVIEAAYKSSLSGGSYCEIASTPQYMHAYIEAGFENCLEMNTYHDYKGTSFSNVALRIDWQLLFHFQQSRGKVLSYSLSYNVVSDHYAVICSYQFEVTLEDIIYSGKNPVIRMCECGYANREFAQIVRERYGENESIKKAILNDDIYNFVTNADKRKQLFDVPSYNAVIQAGIVRFYQGFEAKRIIKKSNPYKNICFSHELEMYNYLQELYPEKELIGEWRNKRVYFQITPPRLSKNKSWFIMKAFKGLSLDEILYSNHSEGVDLVKFLVKIYITMLKKGFIYADSSPRNTIIEESESELIFHLFDFEKSYFVKENNKSNELCNYRVQFFCEELAVMLSKEELKIVTDEKCNPEMWCTENNGFPLPYRPEIDDILKGRGYEYYSLADYNKTEIEVLDTVGSSPHSNIYSFRYPARVKFKAEHYLSCLGFSKAADYERKITEILIEAKKYNILFVTIRVLADLIGLIEEKILIMYLKSELHDLSLIQKDVTFTVESIDRLYFSHNDIEMKKILSEIRSREELMYENSSCI